MDRPAVRIDDHALVEDARRVLDGNWMGHATRPGPRLYPHQWSWDSGFIAIGYAHYQQMRAQQELETLFAAQWSNGLVPHIVFAPAAERYSPGPDFWQVHRSPNAPRHVSTSAIVQPPNHAIAAWHIFRHASDQLEAQAFLRRLYPKLAAWHNFLYRERDPEQEGLVVILHPWASGQDNSPIWDAALHGIKLRKNQIPAYERADLDVVHADDRPLEWAYDRYVYLIDLFRRLDYDQIRMCEESPFLIQDVLFNTLLVEANLSLAKIAEVVSESPTEWEELADHTSTAIRSKLWDAQDGIYFDYDLRAKELIHAHVAAAFSPLYAGIPTNDQAQRMLDRLNTTGFCRLNARCWAVPSYDREQPGFDPKRYWRGPIWVNLNWILCHGLRRYGFDTYAEKVRAAVVELPKHGGMYEYFDPDSMAGHGSPDFSWTAALVIDLLAEEGIIP